MGVEIERKFLVDKSKLPEAVRAAPVFARTLEYVTQGYLAKASNGLVVRVRVATQRTGIGRNSVKSKLTVKGKGTVVRPEFEYDIPYKDAEELLKQCEFKLSKRRHFLPIGDLVWEIDEFAGSLDGLWLAEVELPSEDAKFERPEWLGEEVSENPYWSNARLAERAYDLHQAGRTFTGAQRVVHALREGATLCGIVMTRDPWPDAHTWVPAEKTGEPFVTCKECQARLGSALASASVT